MDVHAQHNERTWRWPPKNPAEIGDLAATSRARVVVGMTSRVPGRVVVGMTRRAPGQVVVGMTSRAPGQVLAGTRSRVPGRVLAGTIAAELA